MDNKNFSITGKVLDSDKNELYKVSGRWDKEIFYESNEEKIKVTEMKEKPLNYEQQFYLCKYALDMNNLSWDMIENIPLTDS